MLNKSSLKGSMTTLDCSVLFLAGRALRNCRHLQHRVLALNNQAIKRPLAPAVVRSFFELVLCWSCKAVWASICFCCCSTLLQSFFEKLVTTSRLPGRAHVKISPFLSRTTKSGFTSATSSAIKPYCGVPLASALVVEGHRLERHDRFAGFVHRFNVVLEAARRESSAQFSIGIDKD